MNKSLLSSILALLFLGGCQSIGNRRGDAKVSEFELAYTSGLTGKLRFHVIEESFTKHIKIYDANELLRGAAKIKGKDMKGVGEFSVQKDKGVFNGIPYSSLYFEEVDVEVRVMFPRDENHAAQVIAIERVKAKTAAGDTLLFMLGDSDYDGEIDTLFPELDSAGFELDVQAAAQGGTEIEDIDEVAHHKGGLVRDSKSGRWNRYSYHTPDKSMMVKAPESGAQEKARVDSRRSRRNGNPKLLYVMPQIPIRAGELWNEAYSALIEACMDDCRTGSTNVTVSKILQSTDANLMAEAESPLVSLETRDAVFRYVDILIAYLINEQPSVSGVSPDVKMRQHACDICRWAIAGLRTEPSLNVRSPIINREGQLLAHSVNKDDVNLSLVRLFDAWHLDETGWLFNRYVLQAGRSHTKSNKAWTEKTCLKFGEKAEHCKTPQEIKELLIQAQWLASALTNAAPVSYCNRIKLLIESLVIPDLELHLMKLEFMKR